MSQEPQKMGPARVADTELKSLASTHLFYPAASSREIWNGIPGSLASLHADSRGSKPINTALGIDFTSGPNESTARLPRAGSAQQKQPADSIQAKPAHGITEDAARDMRSTARLQRVGKRK